MALQSTPVFVPHPGYRSPGFQQGGQGWTSAPDHLAGSLCIRQDSNVHVGLFDGVETATLVLDKNSLAHVHVGRGVELNGVKLEAGDGVQMRNPETLQLTAAEDVEVLVFDLRPLELPEMS